MRKLVLPSTPEASMVFKEWLAEHHGQDVTDFADNAYGYGVIEDDRIVIAVVVQTFHYPGNVLVQYYADDPKVFFQRDLIMRSFLFPFEEPISARRLTLVINSVHERSIGVAKRMGFQQEGRMKFHFGDDDAIILGMIRPGLEA